MINVVCVSARNFLLLEARNIVELVQYNLERDGFRVNAARDGERGLQEASSSHPSLILLDLMLPGMEGLEVCRALRQNRNTRRIPIVILTAKGERFILTMVERGRGFLRKVVEQLPENQANVGIEFLRAGVAAFERLHAKSPPDHRGTARKPTPRPRRTARPHPEPRYAEAEAPSGGC